MRHYSLRVLFLSCFLGLTAGSVLLPLSSIQIVVQAAELGSQGSQDGVIKACTGQSINLGVPQLTEADLKVLTGCSSGVIPQLIEALKSRDWKVKVIAAHTLGLFEKQAQSVIPELSSLMQDENADVRFAVAQALGDIGTEAVVPVLAKALQDKDENVRVGAADGLLKLISQSRTKSLKALISFFEDRNPKTERKGLHNNTQVESRLVLSVLILALEDGNWFLRNRASKQLEKLTLENESNVYQLLKRVTQDDGFVRYTIVNVLGKVDRKILIRILQTNKDQSIRRNVVYVLGMTGSGRDIPILRDVFQDQNLEAQQQNVRRDAAHALRQIGSENSLSVIISSLNTDFSEGFHNVDVFSALRGYDSPQLTEAFIQMFQNRNQKIRLRIAKLAAFGFTAYPSLAKAIRTIESKTAIRILLSTFQESNDPYLRLGIVQLLAQLDPASITFFTSSLSEDENFALFSEVAFSNNKNWVNPKTIQLSNDVLRQLSPKIVQKLIKILRDKNLNSEITSEINLLLYNLAWIGSKDAIHVWEQDLKSNSILKRVSAANILANIGSKEGIPLLIAHLTQIESVRRNE